MDNSVNVQELSGNYEMKKSYGVISMALLLMAVLLLLGQKLLGMLGNVQLADGSILFDKEWYVWVSSFVPLYIVAIPAALTLMKKVPVSHSEKNVIGKKNMLSFICMSIGVMYVGNIVGRILSGLLSGGAAQNGLDTLVADTSVFTVLVVVIIAPIVEELIFRKTIIDRCAVFGEKEAIFYSAITFALFHMNFFQFFYAFGLGLIFAYVYTRTRNIKYSIFLHITINTIGSLLAPNMIKLYNIEAITQMTQGQIDEKTMALAATGKIIFYIYVLMLLAISVTGIIMLVVKRKQFIINESEYQIVQSQKVKAIYMNIGFIVFFLVCAVRFVRALLGI